MPTREEYIEAQEVPHVEDGRYVAELDNDLAGLSPEAREAIIDFRRLEARIDHLTTRAGKRPPDMSRVAGYKVPPPMQPRR